MRSLRHKVGRWLLRDATTPEVHVQLDGAAIVRAIRNHQRRNGGKSGLA